MHLVDTTLFFSPTGGGVKRYLLEKHAWLAAHTSWRHSILVPGAAQSIVPGSVCTIRGGVIPRGFNYRLPLSPARWIRLLDRLEPDLIEVADAFHPAWCAAAVARRRGIPAVAFFHSNLPELVGRRLGATAERALGRYLRWLYERFDLVFAPSREMCAYLASFGVRHTVQQPLGVDAGVFSPVHRRLDLRQRLGLPAHTRLLVYAGRFAGEKNLPVLLQTFARLREPYHLLLIGGDRSARPQSNVTMVPYRRDSVELAEWLSSCDALVHAGTQETFGLVLIEAMACGRPVVGVRAGSVPELIEPSIGLLAEPNDPASLAEAVAALYERDLDAMGQTARARVLERFTWGQAFERQMAAYASVLAGAPRADFTAAPARHGPVPPAQPSTSS
jgi:alpha-1,6-mannosyltransferase